MTSRNPIITVTCPKGLRDTMIETAERAHPLEACGLLVGWWEVGQLNVTDLALSLNRAENPSKEFEIDTGLQLRLQRSLRGTELSLVGIWHSHPSGDCRPSKVDSLAAFDPDYVWFITSTGGLASETSVHLAPENEGDCFRPVTIKWLESPILPA